jgi:hypothetical protein
MLPKKDFIIRVGKAKISTYLIALAIFLEAKRLFAVTATLMSG